MAEPTLGRRIMIEATICKDAPAGSTMASKAWADLRALCARADAAEREMVVMEALVDELQAAFKRDMSSVHKTPFTGIGHTVELARATEALAAWRALVEVQS